MKWIFRLITLGILLAAIGIPFWMKNKQGEPMLSLPGLPDLDQISMPELPQPASVRTVYKWKDADGVWHYGDQPPAGVAFTTLEVNDQINVIQFLNDEERARLQPEPAPQVSASKPGSIAEPMPTPEVDAGISLERALNLMNEAKAVREQMDARNRELDRIANRPER